MKLPVLAVLLSFFTSLFAMDVQQDKVADHHQAVANLPVQLNIENKGSKLDGYSLQIELREVNNPVFQEAYPLHLAPSSSESMPLDMGSILTPMIQQRGVAASNLIARLINAEGEVVSDTRFGHSFSANGFAGLKVVISPKDPAQLELGNNVEIFATRDAEGQLPLN